MLEATPLLLTVTKYDQIVSVNENQSNYKNILPSNIFPLTAVAAIAIIVKLFISIFLV